MSNHATRTRDSKGHKRCLLFSVTDFGSLMRPIIRFSWIFGFFPYNYKSEECVFSKKKVVYSIIVVCLHLVLQIYNLLLVNFFDTRSTVMVTMPQNFFILLDGSIPLLLFAAPFSMSVIFAKLSKISRTLLRQDFNDMAKVIYTVYIVNIVCFTCFIPLYFYMALRVPPQQHFINLYLAMSSTMATMFYLSYVCILGACFKRLNENLKRLNRPSTGSHIELAEKKLSRRQSVMLLTKVKYYEEVHEKISDAVEYLNTLFRVVNIIFATSTFVLVTIDLYNSIAQWYASVNVEGLIHVTLRFGKFCVIVLVCETAANHAAEITTTIHDCINHYADDTVKRELKYFALQVRHRDITFTTKAFNINGKLLSQILSAILMYMIILYQFLRTSNCTN